MEVIKGVGITTFGFAITLAALLMVALIVMGVIRL